MTLINSKNIVWLLKILLLTFFVLVLQLLVCPNLVFYGAVPNCALTFIILMTLIFDVEVGIPLAVSMAIVFYQFLYKPTFLFNWLIAPVLARYVKLPLSLGRELLWIIHVGLVSFLLEIINVFIMSMSNGMQMFTDNIAKLVLIPIFNCVLAVPMLFILKKLFKITEYSHY